MAVTAPQAGVVSLLLALAACATAHPPPPPLRVPDVTLVATAGAPAVYPRDLGSARLTAFVFFARGCGCFAAHQDRLRALVTRFAPLGVRFVIVDPETDRTVDGDAREAASRNLPAPIYLDPGAKLARAMKAEFATYAVVIDAAGRVGYRGGLDSDRSHLKDSTTPYLADALSDLLAGRPARIPEAKTLGCVLETW